jgi:4-amino-4-deoxy-L-arabinose transferase-like glycosyltransferase
VLSRSLKGSSKLFALGILWLTLWWFYLASAPNTPPALHHDEAFNALDAFHLPEIGWPVFFPGNSGREPLFIYILSAFMRLLGPNMWAIRLPGIIIWGLTAPALLWLICELFPGQENSDWLKLTPLLLLITSAWYAIISHFADRANLFVLLETMFFASLWRSWRLNSLRWGILSGIFWGLSFYTYLANRFMPLVLLPLFLWALFFQRTEFKARRRLVLTVAVTAVVVMAPLLIYFARHPAFFTMRASQIMVGSKDLAKNVWRVSGMFFFAGDKNPRHNLPGRPAFTWWVFPLFVAAIIGSLTERRGFYGFLWLWFTVMLLPTLLTIEAPNFLRASGAIPPLIVLMGSGANWLINWGKRLGKARLASATVAIILLAEGLSGLWTFYRWIHCPDVFYAFDEGLTKVAQYILANPPTNDIVYVSPRDLSHPTLRFFLETSGVDHRVRSFDARRVLVVNPDEDVRYVIITYEDFRFELMAPWLWPEGGYKTEKLLSDRAGNTYAKIVYVPAGTKLRQPLWTKKISWQDNIMLIGADPISCCDYRPGDIIYLELWWTTGQSSPTNSWTIFTHLLDSQGRLIVGDDGEPGKGSYPTNRWQAGELIITEYQLFIPKDAPPGEYTIEIGLYNWQTGERLPLADQEGDAVILGKVYVR